MASRIYAVTETATQKLRLIEAESVNQAMMYVAKPAWTVGVASAKDVAMAMAEGATVEVADKLRPRGGKQTEVND